MSPRVLIPEEKIKAFCRQWKIKEIALFGSVLRDDFNPASDVDVLVSWFPDAAWGLFSVSEMQEELSQILGRKVDLVSRTSIENSRNWIRKRHILENAETVYAA